MLPCPLALRLNPSQPIRDQIREAARLGAKGVVLDAIGDLAPQQLGETGRRELRHLLRSVDVTLAALSLPTRRPFDTTDQLDDRLRRAESAFTLAYELGTTLVLARVGGLPDESNALARETFLGACRDLGRRADHRGVRLAMETSPDSGATLRGVLDGLMSPGLAASIDPASLQQSGHDPLETIVALGPWVAHAYMTEAHASAFAVRRAGVLDWAEYLGSLEEVNYRGYLTVWPDPNRPAGPQFSASVARLKEL
jgi:sugar phosphate isomerase/epimerase